MRKHFLIAVAVAAVILGALLLITRKPLPGTPIASISERGFSFFGLQTDTSKASIPLDAVLSGGPGKDGIPAIDDPRFTSVDEADFSDDALGILVEFDGQARFYPYAVLVWHEIVNDRIGETEFAVTFCPLCGSAIVFDRKVGGETLEFGVSGLLWESNLLMFDRGTESLWSQAKNEAVIGHFSGTRLKVLPMRLMPFSEVRERYPDAQVLSKETGYRRDYDRNPYAGYELDDSYYFPVSVSDTRLPAKEIMYVVPAKRHSYAFPQLQLEEGARTTFTTPEGDLTLQKNDFEITSTLSGVTVPGYYEMWFSWATHHQDDGILLQTE